MHDYSLYDGSIRSSLRNNATHSSFFGSVRLLTAPPRAYRRPDNAVINRVELSSRLLKLELHGAGSFHAVGQDKGVADRLADDNKC